MVLNVVAQSRHPKWHKAYQRVEHKYSPDYVNPKKWTINLSAELPPESATCEWQIYDENDSLVNDYRQENKEQSFGSLTADVAREGKYTVKITVTGEDGQIHSQQKTITIRDYLAVAFGDSYFCGEGNPDVPGDYGTVTEALACNFATFTKFLIEKASMQFPMKIDPVWQEREVHRSNKSGVSLAMEDLEDGENGRVITFLNFARSGASIEKGFLHPRDEDNWTDIGQIEEARKTIGGRPIDLLLISVGGNDIQFSDRLLDLLRDDLPLIGDGGLLGDDALNRQREVSEALRHLEALPEKFEKLAEAVSSLNPAHVFLTEYPIAQFDTVNEKGEVVTHSGCGIFDGPDMDIDENDADVIKHTGEKLCETLQEMAERYGWTYVSGIIEGFAGHGRCSDDKYFISAEESCKRQGNFKGTMHPNEKGNRVYADCIAAAVREQLGF